MQGKRSRYGLAWAILVVGFGVGIVTWGVRLSAPFGSVGEEYPAPSAAASSVAPGIVVPSIVTLPLGADSVGAGSAGTVTGSAGREQLCAELSPRVKTVTVESASGEFVDTISC
ncbi:MAG: hypothetical protein WDM88_04510 [Galbitalea sp.]